MINKFLTKKKIIVKYGDQQGIQEMQKKANVGKGNVGNVGNVRKVGEYQVH